ncbi:GNAT family acetyltransferase [Congregicoccus parvus]|uniref:GNAT family acetyltransferase n=1 Tax=Congregicoccus parvus TaxID=3081749 RepID=UPI003FA53987
MYSIEPYAGGHREEVCTLWREVFGYTEARNAPELSIDKKTAWGDGLFWVALESGRVIGTIMAGYDGHRGWIYSLAVRPETRHRGVGSALLRHAEARLAALGCLKVNLQLVASNGATVAFYESLGYRVEARVSMGRTLGENVRH